MRIILTGATGFIGTNLLKKLSSKSNYKILCISRSNLHKKNSKNIFFVKSDLSDLKKNSKFISKFCPQILIHLAWDNIPNFNSQNSKNNEKNSKKLIDFVCKNTNINHILVSGSCFEIQPPNNSYKYFVKAKKNILKFLKKNSKIYKVNFSWLRIFYVYGSNQRKGSIIPHLLSCVKEKRLANINEPNKRHDFVHIDDVCDSILYTIKNARKSNILEIGTGKVSSIKKIAGMLKEISNNQLRYNVNKKSKKNSILKADIKKTKKNILWEPKINIKLGLKMISKKLGYFNLT